VRGGVVDARTDVYSTGVVLYELLTGQRLYEAGDDPDYHALARMVLKGEHRLPSDVDPTLAPFDSLIARALRPKAGDRFQTAAELRDAIQTALVAVDPTLSIDALGEFLRELFATEMLQQREMLDRAAAAQLADYEQQLSRQAVATVSFALSGSAHEDSSTSTRAVAPAPPRPPHPNPTVSVPAPHRRRRRRRFAATLALCGGAGLAVGLTIALTRGSPSPAVGPSPRSAPAPRSLPVVEPEVIELSPPTAPDHPSSEPPSPEPAVKRGPRRPSAPVAPDADALRAKFQAATREYKDYTRRMGSRLETEWTDLASMVGLLNTVERRIAFDKKIDRLRARMRE